MDIYPDNLTTPISRYFGDTKVITEGERRCSSNLPAARILHSHERQGPHFTATMRC